MNRSGLSEHPAATTSDESSPMKLRNQLRQQRSQLSESDRAARSQKICDRLRKTLLSENFDQVAGFRPFQNEPDILSCNSVNWAYPKMVGDQLRFLRVLPEVAEGFERNSFGIEQPREDLAHEVTLTQNSLMLVPGVVFNHEGWRIGLGKGYYDRFLADYPGKAYGVCFDFQLLNQSWVRSQWDQALDGVVTESLCVELKRKG